VNPFLKTLLISSPLVIGGVELGLRLVGYSLPVLGMPDRATGWSLRPGAEGLVRTENKQGVQVRINSDGLRDREHSIRKPASTFRIAVLGDSLCEATEVPLGKTFWSILEQKLSRCELRGGPKVEVINFGVAGFSTAQELLMLRTRVWKYQPDIVLLAFTGSDVSENFRPLSGNPLAPYFILTGNQLDLDDSFRGIITHEWVRNTWAGAAQHLRTLQLVRELIQRARQSSRSMPGNDKLYVQPVDREWQEAWSITENLIRLFHLETVQHGAAFWIVTMSNDIQVHPEQTVRDEFRRKYGASDLFYPDGQIQRLCARENIQCITLAEAMASYAERERVFLHGFTPRLGFGHWNENGHRVAGELIAGRLCRDLSDQPAIQHAQKADSASGR
jgi:hypothetical protein